MLREWVLNYSWKASPNRWGRQEFNATFSIGFGNGWHIHSSLISSLCINFTMPSRYFLLFIGAKSDKKICADHEYLQPLIILIHTCTYSYIHLESVEFGYFDIFLEYSIHLTIWSICREYSNIYLEYVNPFPIPGICLEYAWHILSKSLLVYVWNIPDTYHSYSFRVIW